MPKRWHNLLLFIVFVSVFEAVIGFSKITSATLASFPGPAQLSVAFSTVKRGEPSLIPRHQIFRARPAAFSTSPQGARVGPGDETT